MAFNTASRGHEHAKVAYARTRPSMKLGTGQITRDFPGAKEVTKDDDPTTVKAGSQSRQFEPLLRAKKR
ncbi:hypothetical protein PG985_001824 [Apiospora marii]|uniref:Uncharacterized protein n=1 Tax=Apiospora marii TaxID=335849 RepID=A0ABR1S130_9PEZI